MEKAIVSDLTDYERAQSFNPIVTYLHSIRYRELTDLFELVSRSIPGTIRVLDIGCAHAKTFGLLNGRFDIAYTGIELDREASATAARRYGHHPNFTVHNESVLDRLELLENADVVLALETLEHIPEHLVVRIVEAIGRARPPAFLCTVPNEVGPIVLVKNIGSWLCGYSRHHEYSWRETFAAGFFNLDAVSLHGTGHKGFDWRWLAQTIRYNVGISRISSNPFRWLPKTLSFSVFIRCLNLDDAGSTKP